MPLRDLAGPATTYRTLLAQPYLSRFLAALICLRLGGGMYSLVAVLFALDRFKSPALAPMALLRERPAFIPC